jgi:hypothetical protein
VIIRKRNINPFSYGIFNNEQWEAENEKKKESKIKGKC